MHTLVPVSIAIADDQCGHGTALTGDLCGDASVFETIAEMNVPTTKTLVYELLRRIVVSGDNEDLLLFGVSELIYSMPLRKNAVEPDEMSSHWRCWR